MYPGNVGPGYEVVDRCGCVMIRGRAPMRKVLALVECMPHRTTFSASDLAFMARAEFVAGRPEDLYRLRFDLREEAMEHLQEKADGLEGLSREAIEWMAWEEKWASTAIAFHACTGVVLPAYRSSIEEQSRAHPGDSSSFHLLMRMVDMVPEVRAQLAAVADLSPQWQRLIRHYEELAQRLRQDTAGKPAWILGSPAVDRALIRVL